MDERAIVNVPENIEKSIDKLSKQVAMLDEIVQGILSDRTKPYRIACNLQSVPKSEIPMPKKSLVRESIDEICSRVSDLYDQIMNIAQSIE